MDVGGARMSICELRIISTMCKDSNFERMPCDLRSRSLGQPIRYGMNGYLEEAIYIPFSVKWLHCKLTHSAEHQEGVFEEKIFRGHRPMIKRAVGM
jgi:hypothetical protein